MRRNILRIPKLLILSVIISALMLFAASAANVVFLKDGGTGDGSSPSSAVNTLTKAHDALDLTKDDATIVVCGPYTQSVNWLYKSEYTGTVTFTSVYDGVDYRETADAVYNAGKLRFLCLGNNIFENLDFNCTGECYLIVGQHNSVTVGEGVKITGEKLLGETVASSFAILGGYQDGASLAAAESTANTNVTVLSGSNLYIVPFSRGIEGAKFTGTANITIGGNAEVGVLHGSAANPDGGTVGKVNIKIQDNAAIRNFYGCTSNITAASYAFTMSGGSIESFNWVCPATADKTLTVTGSKKLTVSGDADYHSIMNEFDSVNGGNVAFLKDGANGDGSTLAGAADTLKEAFSVLDLSKDCTIVICGPFTQTSDFAYGKSFTGSVTFTSVYGGVDYRKSAGAKWQFGALKLACYGATSFTDIDLVATGEGYTVVGQHNPVTVGEGVTVTGDALAGTNMANSFVIMGGYYKGFGSINAVNANTINITVLSGSNLYILAYSREVSGVYRGKANITVGGTADVGVVHASCAYPNGITVGDVKLTITDSGIVRRLYGCTQDSTVNSIEVDWISGSFRSVKWALSSSCKYTVKNPTVLRVSDKAAATMYYEDVAKNFDAVVYAPSVETDISVAKTDAATDEMLITIAGPVAYNALVFDGSDAAQIFMSVPKSETSGKLYRIDGDFVVPLNSHDVGNGLLGFDIEEDGVYISSVDDFIVFGDANFDKKLTVADTMLIVKRVLGDEGILAAGADADNNREVNFLDVLRQLKAVVEVEKEEEFTFDPADYNVISEAEYLDKTKLGFLSQLVGFLSGYEFARDPSTNLPLIAMSDSYFEMCNGAYADPKEINLREDKLRYNEETGVWEIWNDDDFSIDILDQHILRDMYDRYGTVNTKVITDDWVDYDVYDMGGGNRDIGAYGLMKNYRYLSVFSGNTEMCNNFNVNGEPYIGNETLGMNTPGMPDLAMALAHKFGSATSDRDPLEWLKMFSAMYSMAYFEDDIPTLIRAAQSASMAEGSWHYEVVDECFKLYEKYPTDWRKAVTEADSIFRSVNYDNSSYMGCTSINCSFIILGLLYGDGDYYDTCKIISLAGHGGDSTTPTALGIVGIITGWDGLDSTSKTIINEKVWQDGEGVIVNLPVIDEENPESYGTWMYMAGLEERFMISDLIDMYQANFENILEDYGGFKLDGKYYIPRQTISKVDTVYAEHFEDGGRSKYSITGGTAANPADPFMGENALELRAGSKESTAYTTVSGLTVGKTYKLSAFIRTSNGVTAHMFVREKGAAVKNFVTVHDSNVYVRRFTVGVGENDMCSYVKRELVFTATASSMEIGFMLPSGTVSGGSVAADAVEVIRFEETKAADVTVNGARKANGAYNGLIRFDIDGGCEKEAWLKVTYSSNATTLEKAFTLVNRSWQSRTPIVPTNGGNVTIYIPVLVNNEESNLVTIYVGETDVTVHEAALVSVKDRF